MGTIFLRSDSDKWGQGLKWGQSESGDNMLFLRIIKVKILQGEGEKIEEKSKEIVTFGWEWSNVSKTDVLIFFCKLTITR